MSEFTDSLRDGAHALLDKAADWQERIRERAQAIWEREGGPKAGMTSTVMPPRRSLPLSIPLLPVPKRSRP